jgi:hypothetical protein
MLVEVAPGVVARQKPPENIGFSLLGGEKNDTLYVVV